MKILVSKKYDFSKELTFFPAQEFKHSLRFCEEEKKTKQVLGIQTTNRKDGEILYPGDDEPRKELILISSCNFRWGNDETRVDKNFYY